MTFTSALEYQSLVHNLKMRWMSYSGFYYCTSHLIGAGFTIFAYNILLRACEHAHTYCITQKWLGESAIWHAQARARQRTGLRLSLVESVSCPDRTISMLSYLPVDSAFCAARPYTSIPLSNCLLVLVVFCQGYSVAAFFLRMEQLHLSGVGTERKKTSLI